MGQGNRLCSPQLETPAAVNPFPMDTITSLITRIHHETLPTPPSSPSKSTITPPPDVTNTPSGDLPPPRLNELRGFSTALSDFLICYDELWNHINYINSSIDSKLSGHLTHTTTNTNPNLSPQTNLLKTLSNQTIPAFPEVLSDQIPKKYQGRNGIATAAECDACLLSSDGIDTSKKAEIVGTSSPSFNRKQIDNGKRYIGIRLSKWGKWGAEVSKRHRRNKRIIRSSIWLGSYTSPIAAARAYDTAVFYFRGAAARFNFPDLVGEYGCLSDLSMASIQKKAKEVGAKVDALLSRNRSADQHGHLVSTNSEEIDVCMKDADIDTSKKAEEVDVLNNPEEIGTSMKAEEVHVLNNPEEIDTSKKAEEVDVLNNPEEIDTSKKAEVVDASNSLEEIDTCMQDVEMDTSKAEDIDIGNNPEEVDLLINPEEVDVWNNPVEVDVSNNHVDLSNNSEEIDAANKPEEIDVSNNPEEVDISNNPGEVDVSKDPEEVDLSNNSEEVDLSNNSEEIDVSNNPEEVDIANNPKEADVSMDTEETDDISMKLEETDVLKKHAETDNSKKLEEMVAETFCAQTITTVPVAVVLEQNPNEMATNCEQDHESTTALGIFEEVDVINKPEVVDTFKKSEQTDILKKPEQTVILKRPKEIDILRKAEQTDIFKNSEDMDTSMNPLGIYASKNSEEAETAKKHEETGISKKAEEIDVSRKLKETENSKKGIVCVLEVLCKNMYASLVRKHVITYWYSMNKLHKEIAKALKMAKYPARLVLHSIQRFFMNSWKSYVKDSRQKVVRLASVLILECFVMINGDGIEISKTEKEYAEQVATDWRDRMSKGGGLGQTDEIDARGLLLFISGFGIRDDVFKIQDIVDLIRASNVKEISNALRASVFLIPKIPEVIDYMVKNNLEIEAADIAYTLGLEDVCHPENILRTYLHSIVKDSQNSSSFQTLEAMKQHLCDLKSVKQCLESHNVDPSILLLDFEINARIQNLERETNEGRLTQKMKCLENPIHPEANDESMQKLAGHAETDSSNGTEAAVTETSCAQTINSVSAAVVLKQNPSRMAPNHKQTPEKVEVVDISKKHDILKNPEETETGNSKKSIISALESYCQNMSFKNLVTHVTTHFSEMRNCHEEIVKALKLAADPAKLVLYSIGRFFLQSSSTFYKDPHQTVLRLALVSILECFVMMSCDRIEIANTEKEHAVDTAAEWRNRMIKEGGLGHTDEVDARGLLLFISGFGIQDDVFTIQDIMDLIMASNVKGISTALRGSVFLMAKLPEVIDLMMKNKFQTKAVDIAYTLGLEDKCSPQNILRMYLHSLVKDIQLDSSLQTLDTRKQQLFNLKSIKQCLESHKVDPSILLPDFKVNEMIEYLLIEVNVEEMTLKRKSLENPTHPEAKRACLNRENMPHQHKLVVGHHGVIPYNQSTQPSTRYFNNSENKDGLVPNGPAYGLPGSYDQSVHRADVPPSGWHGPNGQTYVPQPDGRQCERVPPEPFSYVPPSGGLPGRPGPRQPFPGYKEVPPSGGLPGRPGPRQPFPGYKEVPPSGGFPGRQDPPEPYSGVKNYPPSGGFPRRQGPSADLYSFIDKI